jgi:hypothetical protein
MLCMYQKLLRSTLPAALADTADAVGAWCALILRRRKKLLRRQQKLLRRRLCRCRKLLRSWHRAAGAEVKHACRLHLLAMLMLVVRDAH